VILLLWPLAMVVRASFLHGFGWFLPPLYFLCQISTLKIIEPQPKKFFDRYEINSEKQQE